MPGSSTTPGRPGARDDAPVRVAFRLRNSVGARDMNLSRLNGWPMRSPADASPPPLRTTDARLRADVDRYSFIVSDFHRLLLAGLPAHCERFWTLSRAGWWPRVRSDSLDSLFGKKNHTIGRDV